MKRLFECTDDKFFRVPDGTLVNPFLNAKDVMSGLPWDTLDGLSIAAGHIETGSVSQIHVHPFVSLVTVLMSGSLHIHMKDPGSSETPYTVRLELPTPKTTGRFTTVASLALPGTFFQLDNSHGSEPAQVLYLTTPSYIFEPGESTDAAPVYDDAITLGRDWKRLVEHGWNPPELSHPTRSYAARQSAIQRLAKRSRSRDKN